MTSVIAGGYDGGYYGGGRPYFENGLSDGYWLGNDTAYNAYEAGPAAVGNFHPNGYEPDTGLNSGGSGQPDWAWSGKNHGVDMLGYDAYGSQPGAQQVGYCMSPGYASPGMGFRPTDHTERAPVNGWGGYRSDPGSANRFGKRTATGPFGFRPKGESPARASNSPVWYRERHSGKRYRFRPVSEQELVARPSDHSFNSLRYSRPEAEILGYPAGNGYAPVGPVDPGPRDPGNWGNNLYGGPIYGFD